MGISVIWDAVEGKANAGGFTPSSVGSPGNRTYRITARRADGDNEIRGGIGNSILRMVWNVGIELTWTDIRDRKAERDAAGEAETMARSVYGLTSVTCYHFDGMDIELAEGRITARLRFKFQTSKSG